MASPTTVYFPVTGDPLVDATTHGYKWALDSTRTIDWSVSNGFGGEFWFNPQVVAQYAGAMLATYSYYADIKFNFVGLYATPATALASGSEMDLWLSGSLAIFPSSQIWARAYFPEPSLDSIYTGQDGDVILNINSQANFLPSYEPGSAGWFVFMHELGHALGLKHPHDDGGTGRPTLAQIGLGVFDQDWATIMSYEDSYDWNLRSWDPATPMILDVLALQYLYGRNMATNAGDDIYDVSSHGAYTTIWDASGSDIASALLSPVGMIVQLPEYQLSSLVPTRAGFAMRLDEFFANITPTSLAWLAGDIEGAVGSPWADVLLGSSNADAFSGEGGDDFIDGGLGDDRALMYGSRSQYVLAKTQDGGYTLTDSIMGRDAADSVYQVETLQFLDRTVDLTMGLHVQGLAAADIKTLEELYVGFFDRVPEADGLAYWLDQLKAGVTLISVANQFYSAGVQFGLYQSDMTNQQFIREVYENVLGRPPGIPPTDAEVDYWNQRLMNGADTKGSMVLTMLHDVHAYFEHDPTYGFVAALLNNKAAVAEYYALQQGLSLNVQADNIAFGTALADLITPTDTAAAISFIGVNQFSML